MKTTLVRRLSVALVASVFVAAGSVRAGEEPRPEPPSEPPHYESPIVSLLFLPVTLLIKIAEVVSPEPAKRTERSTEK